MQVRGRALHVLAAERPVRQAERRRVRVRQVRREGVRRAVLLIAHRARRMCTPLANACLTHAECSRALLLGNLLGILSVLSTIYSSVDRVYAQSVLTC